MRRCAAWMIAMLFFTGCVTAGTALAQGAEKDPGWSDTAELTVVFTGGNAESSTLGVKNAPGQDLGSGQPRRRCRGAPR